MFYAYFQNVTTDTVYSGYLLQIICCQNSNLQNNTICVKFMYLTISSFYACNTCNRL